jgi:protoporphyrinogen/coproporphyrinogen III oxidase
MTRTVQVAVVGGGIAGLAAAERAAEQLGLDEVLLLEADSRLGGKIATERVAGYVVEGGPDCFLAAKPAGVELCRRLGLAERLRPTSPAFRRSFVKRDGRLHELPDGLTGLVPSRIVPLLTTRILSLAGRARAALEPMVARRRERGEESVAQFVTRRFGREAYEWLVEPLLSGIFAGDGAALSLPATFPQLAEAEDRHGSVLWPMLKARFGPRLPAGAPLGFVTPAAGLAELVDALEARLTPDAVWLEAGVESLRRLPAGYRLELADGRVVDASSVILALPAFHAARLVESLDATLAATLRDIPFVSTLTVSAAFPRSAVPRLLPGSGYVSPRAEGGSVVACTWTSNKFPERVPDDGVLIRFFLGRAGREDVVGATDGGLKRLVRAELAAVHGITAEPRFWRIFRWPRALPQYTVGHRDRLDRIGIRLARLPGLFVAGASYRGVGIPDCITSGWDAAGAAVARARELVA